MLTRPRLSWLLSGAALVAAATVGATQAATAQTQAATAQTKAPAAPATPTTPAISKPWPKEVDAPSYESWLSSSGSGGRAGSGGSSSIATSVQQSGSPYETIAFLQTA